MTSAPTAAARPSRLRRYAPLLVVGAGLLLVGLIGELGTDPTDSAHGGLVVEVVDARGEPVGAGRVHLHLLHLESNHPPVQARPGEQLSLPPGRWELRAVSEEGPPLRRELLVSTEATARVRLRLGG